MLLIYDYDCVEVHCTKCDHYFYLSKGEWAECKHCGNKDATDSLKKFLKDGRYSGTANVARG